MPEKINVRVRFFGALNDFLDRKQKGRWIERRLNGHPSIGDTAESLGVPHPEIAKVLVNGKPALLSRQLRDQDRVRVWPMSKVRDGVPKFILDVHLGKLAKYLRLFGFDTLYRNDYSDRRIVQILGRGGRTVLTRDIGLLKRKKILRGYWLREEMPPRQLEEVLARFAAPGSLAPFSRCLCCNGRLRRVTKQTVEKKLPPKTRKYYQEFYRCSRCAKIYWPGSHYRKMKVFIKTQGGPGALER
ncbi:MAG: Mut7-C RNAse domain-containing protein [Candidatus Omnitrophota bacterium]